VISGRSRVFALLGDPVAHSLSPAMHNAGFRAAGLDAIYVPLRCAAEDLHGVMRTLALQGGGGNVTVPHKQVAAAAAPGDARVTALGVANVFASQEGQLRVANTDVDGVLALLDGMGVPRGSWCVVGTGGSARAVVGAAGERGARLAVISRDHSRGESLLRWAAERGVQRADATECQVVINATPLGLRPDDPLPIELGAMPVVTHVADLTYRADAPTALIELARSRGLGAADGREMLLTQGVAAWTYWFPGIAVPVEVMRAALDGRMG
jgi:shikimate dehydrogenase